MYERLQDVHLPASGRSARRRRRTGLLAGAVLAAALPVLAGCGKQRVPVDPPRSLPSRPPQTEVEREPRVSYASLLSLGAGEMAEPAADPARPEPEDAP
jgi:hypothetical protein